MLLTLITWIYSSVW